MGRASESAEELEFRTWTAVVQSIYNQNYRLLTEKPGDRDRIYHTLKSFPEEIRIGLKTTGHDTEGFQNSDLKRTCLPKMLHD